MTSLHKFTIIYSGTEKSIKYLQNDFYNKFKHISINGKSQMEIMLTTIGNDKKFLLFEHDEEINKNSFLHKYEKYEINLINDIEDYDTPSGGYLLYIFHMLLQKYFCANIGNFVIIYKHKFLQFKNDDDDENECDEDDDEGTQWEFNEYDFVDSTDRYISFRGRQIEHGIRGLKVTSYYAKTLISIIKQLDNNDDNTIKVYSYEMKYHDINSL